MYKCLSVRLLSLILAISIGCSLGAACLEGDLSGDCAVGFEDVWRLAEDWLDPAGSPADIIGNDGVDMADFAAIAKNWGMRRSPVVINEIHCDPDVKIELVEFIELYNISEVDVNIAGWYFSDGVTYQFPAGAMLPAGGYVVVAKTPTQVVSKFRVSPGVVYGPWVGSLNNDGEQIVLRDRDRQKVDEVDYGLGFPWPTVGDPVPPTQPGTGHSMQLLNPRLDNDLGGSWRSATPSPAAKNGAVYADNTAPQIRQVKHSPKQPMTGEDIVITAKITDPDGVDAVRLLYQLVEPGNYIPAFLPLPVSVVKSSPETPFDPNPAFENPANWTEIAMVDDGSGGDEIAGDSTYTATIPAQSTNRTLVRYRIKAEDMAGESIRVPYLDDPSLNFACYVYNGVPSYTAATRSVLRVGHTYSQEIMTSLPVYTIITRAADLTVCMGYKSADRIVPESCEGRSKFNWECAFVYEGVVYDHVLYRLRQYWERYSGAGKRSMRFRFPLGNYLQARDNFGKKYPTKWRILNTGKCAVYSGTSGGLANFGLSETINNQLFNMVGVPSPWIHAFHFRVVDGAQEAPSGTNGQYYGDFWGLYIALEDYDARYIDAHNLLDGNLYKLKSGVMDGNKVRRNQGLYSVSDASDFDTIHYYCRSNKSDEWLNAHVDYNHWNWYNVVCEAVLHRDYYPADSHLKNRAWYFEPYEGDPYGMGRLHTMPFDTDASWGCPSWNGAGDYPEEAIYADHLGGTPKENFKLEHRNVMRAFRDLVWTKEVIYPMIDDLAAMIEYFVPADRDRWKDAPSDAGYQDWGPMEDKIYSMKTIAFDTINPADYPGGGGLPSGVGNGIDDYLDNWANSGGDATRIPYTPVITSLAPPGYPINTLTFQTSVFSDPQGSGTFQASKWRIGEVTDLSNPVYDPADPRIYEMPAVWESEEIADSRTTTITIPASAVRAGHTYRVRCRMQDNTNRWSHWSSPIQFIVGGAVAAHVLDDLRITEVMYNPVGANISKGELNVDSDEFEFIELKNIGEDLLDLKYVSFVQGITFNFYGSSVTSLSPGQFVLVVRNKAAFESRYGTGLSGIIAGQYIDYGTKLDNAGETVQLVDTWNGTIALFTYSDDRGWPLPADGSGHSLVPLASALPGEPYGSLYYGGNWRHSAYLGGSPGADDPELARGVVLNEVMAHTDYSNPAHPEYDSDDWIELYNTGGMGVNLSGWYLSDDKYDLKKWAIPSVNIGVGGRVSFDEVTGFHNPITSGFGLDKAGEEVLLSFLPGTSQDRVVDYVRFKGEENFVSLGRYPDGGLYWFHTPPSRDLPNNSGIVDIVVDELMYHPVDPNEEYIELYNPTGGRIYLENADGTWRLDGAVDYVFASGMYINAGDRLIVVGFDPATETARLNAFISAYGTGALTPGVDIVGPWSGVLANEGERLALERPQAPDLPLQPFSWVVVDEVIYGSVSPWAVEANGLGAALQRNYADGEHSGNNPANWRADSPTPGRNP